MSLLYQRSYFYYTQITKNFKRNTLSDNAADFLHQRHGPRNQPQDNERIPDPIRQRVVAVIPAGKQRWHDQRIQKRQTEMQQRRGVKQYRQEQPAPNTIINMARPPLESLCHVSLEQEEIQGSIQENPKIWRDSSSKLKSTKRSSGIRRASCSAYPCGRWCSRCLPSAWL